MPLEETDVAAITLLLSPERLSKLTALTGSARIAIDLHQDTLSLNSDLMKIVATIELALRNSICANLTVYFGCPGWIIRPTAPFQWRPQENGKVQSALDSARRAEYSKMTQAQKGALDTLAYPNGRPSGKSHLQRSKDRRRQINVSDGKIVAEITLYFWKRLYGPEYEQTLWRTTLKKTFPNKKLKRASVADKLEVIYQTRNRLAHHEPVLHKRFTETISSIEFIAENLGSVVPSNGTPLYKLILNDLISIKEKYRKLHEKLNSFRSGSGT